MRAGQEHHSTGADKLPVLTKSNFTRWKYELQIILTARGLNQIANGQDRGPTAPELHGLPHVMDVNNPGEVAAHEAIRAQNKQLIDQYAAAREVWVRRDAEAMQLLSRSLDDHHHLMIRGCTHARHIWAQIINLYEQRSNTNIFLAQREFHEMKWQASDSALSFIAKLRLIVAKLDSLGEPVTESMAISKIMNELPHQYQHMRDQWELSTLGGLQLSLEDLQSQLMRVDLVNESRRKPTTSTAALHAHASSKKPPKRKVICHFCSIPGHTIDVCRKKKAQEALRSPAAASKPSTAKQPSTSGTRKPAPPAAKPRTGDAGLVNSFDFLPIEQDWVHSSIAGQQRKGESYKWIIDSGATQHMTGRLDWFSEYHEMPEGSSVTSGNCAVMPIAGQGKINITFFSAHWGKGVVNTFLEPVLYVPNLGPHNLFSVPAVTSKGYHVSMGFDYAHITKSDVTLSGKREGNRYVLDVYVNFPNGLSDWPPLDERHALRAYDSQESSDQERAEANASEGASAPADAGARNSARNYDDESASFIGTDAALIADKQTLKRWHERLAHISPSKIAEMAQTGAVVGLPHLTMEDDFFCEPCVMGKMHRKPFSKAERRSCKPGEFIHSDLCGPMEHPSLSGSRYYAVFKDEATRYRYVRCMQRKDQLLDELQRFVTQVQADTGNRVIRLRTDNGGEYDNKRVDEFLELQGIVHEKTAPYTSEQVGIAEREHRTIMNLARSMLSSSSLPPSLWAEAVTTAAYVMNRVPNRKDKNITPYEKVFGEKPD